MNEAQAALSVPPDESGGTWNPDRDPFPYDSVFRTLLNDCRHLILPLLNETFGETYTGAETIEFFQNEHFQNRQDGAEDRIITDSFFRVICAEKKETESRKEKRYHLECESTSDRKILIRMFEYDAQLALDQDSCIIGDELTVSFPHAAVLFLRSTRNTPDRMKITIETPGGTVSYDVPAIKISDYSIDKLFDSKLYLLIPFYAFNLEKQFSAIEQDEKKLEETISEFAAISNRMEALILEDPDEETGNFGKIDEYTYKTLIEMSNKVLSNLTKKYDKIREGVEKALRGQILNYEAKRIKNEGRNEGRNEGIQIGMLIGSARTYRDELGLDDQTIIGKLSNTYHIPADQVESYIRQMQP